MSDNPNLDVESAQLEYRSPPADEPFDYDALQSHSEVSAYPTAQADFEASEPDAADESGTESDVHTGGSADDTPPVDPGGETPDSGDSDGPEPRDVGVASPSAGSNQMEQIAEQITVLSAQQEAAASAIRDLGQIVNRYEERIVALQEENAELKKLQISKLFAPVFKTLAAIATDAYKAGQDVERYGEETAADYLHFRDQIDDALDMMDRTLVRAEPGVRFDPAIHQAVRTRPTSDPAQDGLVAHLVRDGVRELDSERAVPPAQVFVYAYERQDSAPTSSDPSAGTALPDDPGSGKTE